MTVKLNLTVSEENVKVAKRYAASRKISVSKIVNDFFASLETQDKRVKTKKKSWVEKYGGVIKGELKDIDKVRDEYLREKYGL